MSADPQAFPYFSRDEERDIPGMTLRDYFAGQAMMGMLAGNHYNTSQDEAQHFMSGDAYDIADAMIKMREARR